MSEESDIMDQLRLHWAATDKLVGRLTSISLTRIQAEDAGLPPPDANSKEAIAKELVGDGVTDDTDAMQAHLSLQIIPGSIPVAKAVDEDKERAAFEAWAGKQDWIESDGLSRANEGEYCDDVVEIAWQAVLWRASRG